MKEKIKSYIFIIIIALIVSIPLFNEKFFIYIDDGIQHICRLIGTYQSITEGHTFPVIMSNFCNEFGYSWNLFYSPITAYVPLLLHFITNSFVLDIKIFIVFVTILSGIAMYEFLQKVTSNKFAGLIGAVIYIFAPYRLTDMYIRMALSELTSFIFLPMVFQGLYEILNCKEEKKTGLLLAVSAIGLILTHTVIAMYTAIISLIYVLINFKKLKEKIILRKLIICLILIICVTSFFWAPMLEHKLNTQYEVFKEGRMERTEVLIYYKLDFIDLIYTAKGNMIFEIGLITTIGLVLTILAYKKIEKKYKQLYIFSLITGIISIIITLDWFPFENLPSILKMLQFSFRMLEFSSFFLSFVVAINYSLVIKNFKFRDVIVLSIITVLLTIPNTRNLKYKEDIISEEKLWPSVSVTEKTGRVHAGCASFEYLPSKAFENLEYIKKRKNKVYVLEGNLNILDEKKEGTQMEFYVENLKENSILELPYIYYLGYKVVLSTLNEEIELQTYESKNGFIQIYLNSEIEKGKVTVSYDGTNIMKISMIISILSFTAMIVYYVKRRKYGIE